MVGFSNLYNLPPLPVSIISMDSVSETLRRARELEEKFKQFMERKVEQDRSIEETFKKIEKTQ